MKDYDAHLLATYGPEPEGDEPEPPMTAEEEEMLPQPQPRPLAEVLAEYMDGVRAQRAEDARLLAEHRDQMNEEWWA